MRQATLAQLLTLLRPPALTPLALPRGRTVPLSQPVIHDPTEPVPREPGGVLLAVGCHPETAGLPALLAEAGRHGLAAVVVKAHGRAVEPLVPLAEAAGVALLVVDDSMGWRQLADLAGGAIGSTGGSGDASLSSVAVGDLFALANAVAVLTGGATAIEEQNQRVIAYSSVPGQPVDELRQRSILGRRVADRAKMRGLYRELVETDGVKEIPGGPVFRNRLGVVVRAEEEVLGSIWVVEGHQPFTEGARTALAGAARAAALHLLRAREERDLERHARSEMLQGLLDGRLPTEAAAQRLGLGWSAPIAVIALEVVGGGGADELLGSRLAGLVAVYCEAFRHRSSCVSAGRVTYVAVPVESHAARDWLANLARELVRQAETALGVTLRAGVGSTVDGLRALPRSRDEADEVLRALDGDPRRRLGLVEELRGRIVLRRLRRGLAAQPAERLVVLAELLDHDAARGTGYVPALRAYLDAVGDVPAAARALGMPQNTLRYQLRRIREQFRLPLDDPDARLVLWLQLRLLAET
ncbi:sugar diacid utilization regulator [Crossiella equi]|uniref:Sugar diacid utilization regulator n=1 Tax=Crossiella equi TaxID=130796 RepID=A0ABS5ALN6_9PSEU|nr:helix-turn-helix domain-containing protein [Crossiella equi]MBP2477479.1 sugar diacid utilization regulator [Crossiella equi]